MIGTIRKHSKWLWAVIITATIISFVYWGAGSSQVGSGSGRAGGDFGQAGAFIVTSFGTAIASPFTLFGGALAGQ